MLLVLSSWNSFIFTIFVDHISCAYVYESRSCLWFALDPGFYSPESVALFVAVKCSCLFHCVKRLRKFPSVRVRFVRVGRTAVRSLDAKLEHAQNPMHHEKRRVGTAQ